MYGLVGVGWVKMKKKKIDEESQFHVTSRRNIIAESCNKKNESLGKFCTGYNISI